jgi:ABC-type antimicrobial peptide transport system permease subunit
LIPSARKALRDLDPALSLSDIRTMQERVTEVNAKRRFQMVLLSGFAGLAVFLAMIGIYGVMSYSVKQRTSEIGLRMALGASQGQVLQMVVRQGMQVVLFGLAAGITAGLLLTRVIRGSLYGVPANDPVTFVIIPLLVLAVACCACLAPALDASRVDPAMAIRNE